ncbi:hypothetical protein [Deinococcus planocerae]|uniref:hypothetical protein n=1 Tax=Deinococcus planocerae TaxID=1737569 RepID=UPI000C7F0F38|nr:hypothetical protein [Deinococcus planocerae]
MRPAIPFLLAALSLCSARADSWVDPHPRLFSSDAGLTTYGFKVLPRAGRFGVPATGELFRLTVTGTTPVVWRGTLKNHPLNVSLSPRGHVVTLDTYGGDRQGRHALVIYSPRGQVVADLSFSDVVPGKPNSTKFGLGVSGLFLSQGYQAKFVYYDKPYFALRDAKGTGPVFDLDTGKQKR